MTSILSIGERVDVLIDGRRVRGVIWPIPPPERDQTLSSVVSKNRYRVWVQGSQKAEWFPVEQVTRAR